MANYSGKEIIKEYLETQSVADLADFLDVHVAHIYNIDRRGVSKPLYDALVAKGLIEVEKRYRLHYECGRGEEGEKIDAEIRAEMESLGFSSFTDFVDELRTIAKTRIFFVGRKQHERANDS